MHRAPVSQGKRAAPVGGIAAVGHDCPTRESAPCDLVRASPSRSEDGADDVAAADRVGSAEGVEVLGPGGDPEAVEDGGE